ncbi:MAG: hypothetical protein JWO38_1974 [Gemmataceae bacterium]|nr:hypothetical protein [Gemmataceae bacterium]
MDPAPLPPDTDRPAYTAPIRGIAVASVALGFFSMVVFWWKPFGGLLASTGLVLGLVSLAIGNRGGLRGENLALAGTGICAFSLSVITAVYFALNFVQWGFTPW